MEGGGDFRDVNNRSINSHNNRMDKKELRCPACKNKLTKEIEKVNDGFIYIFKCQDHGIIRKREPTWGEISEWRS